MGRHLVETRPRSPVGAGHDRLAAHHLQTPVRRIPPEVHGPSGAHLRCRRKRRLRRGPGLRLVGRGDGQRLSELYRRCLPGRRRALEAGHRRLPREGRAPDPVLQRPPDRRGERLLPVRRGLPGHQPRQYRPRIHGALQVHRRRDDAGLLRLPHLRHRGHVAAPVEGQAPADGRPGHGLRGQQRLLRPAGRRRGVPGLGPLPGIPRPGRLHGPVQGRCAQGNPRLRQGPRPGVLPGYRMALRLYEPVLRLCPHRRVHGPAREFPGMVPLHLPGSRLVRPLRPGRQ